MKRLDRDRVVIVLARVHEIGIFLKEEGRADRMHCAGIVAGLELAAMDLGVYENVKNKSKELSELRALKKAKQVEAFIKEAVQ